MKSIREFILEQHPDEEFVFYDQCDGAILGVAERCGGPKVIVYDYDRLIIEIAVVNQLAIFDAIQWVTTNLMNAHLGGKTPMIMQRINLN